jgi:hypothetical protein
MEPITAMKKKSSLQPASSYKAPYTRLRHIIQDQATLSKIISTTENLSLANKVLHTHLDGAFNSEIKAIELKKGMLTLQCNNASIATKMRFKTNSLITALKQEQGLEDLFNIQFKVMRTNNQQEQKTIKTTKKKATISLHSKNQIKKAADNIADEKLAEALLRLVD